MWTRGYQLLLVFVSCMSFLIPPSLLQAHHGPLHGVGFNHPARAPFLLQEIAWNASQLQHHMISFTKENPHLLATAIVPHIVNQRGWLNPAARYYGIRFFETPPGWLFGDVLIPGIPARQKQELVRPSYDLSNAANAMIAWHQQNVIARLAHIGHPIVRPPVVGPQYRPGYVPPVYNRPGFRPGIHTVPPSRRHPHVLPPGAHPRGFYTGPQRRGNPGLPVARVQVRPGALHSFGVGFRNIFHLQLEANLINAFANASIIREALDRLYFLPDSPFFYDIVFQPQLRWRLYMIQFHLNNLRYLVDVVQHSSVFHAYGVGYVGNCFAKVYPRFNFGFGIGAQANVPYAVAAHAAPGADVQFGAFGDNVHAGHVGADFSYSRNAGYGAPGQIPGGDPNQLRRDGVGPAHQDAWHYDRSRTPRYDNRLQNGQNQVPATQGGGLLLQERNRRLGQQYNAPIQQQVQPQNYSNEQIQQYQQGYQQQQQQPGAGGANHSASNYGNDGYGNNGYGGGGDPRNQQYGRGYPQQQNSRVNINNQGQRNGLPPINLPQYQR